MIKMIFVVAMATGILSRILTLNLDSKQYPSQPNILVSQMVLAVIASALGALLVPALANQSYTSITFLSLAAEQFRSVRKDQRNTLQNLEDLQLVKRGEAYIEEIARTYETRNYICILTAIMTGFVYRFATVEFHMTEGISITLGAITGIALALILKKVTQRQSLGDIADVVPAKINFDGPLIKVDDVVISNIGLESSKQRFLEEGLAIRIIPKDGDYVKAGIINNPGQRQAIAHTAYIRMGVFRDADEPDFTPLIRRDSNDQSMVMPFVPLKKDMDKLIEAVKSAPVLETAKGKNIALKKYNTNKKGSAS
jgi:uncharacterized protein